MKAPKIGGGYRLITDPWKVIETLERFRPTTVEISDKSTLLPVARWARRNDIGSVLFSHERLDAMLSLSRTGRELGGGPSTARVIAGVGALYKPAQPHVRRCRGDVSLRGGRVRRGDHATGPDPARCRPGHLPPVARPTPVDDGVLKLVHAGRLSREKSPHLAVATAAELHRRGVHLRMDVYGSGPHLDELIEIAGSRPGHLPRVRRRPPNAGPHLAEADVALSVCPGETFGLAVLEALAAGTPVVTAEHRWCPRTGRRVLRPLGTGDPGRPSGRRTAVGPAPRPQSRGPPPGRALRLGLLHPPHAGPPHPPRPGPPRGMNVQKDRR